MRLKLKYLNIISIAVFSFVANSCRHNNTSQPNVVIIFTDDQGYHDLGCYGAKKFQTPHVDRLAQQGIKFTDFYVAASVCTPSRASLLTGCYPQRVGLEGVLFPTDPAWTKGLDNKGLNPDETTLPEILKTQGYATACVGKWHLGHHKAFLPVNHGFDEFFGLPYSNDMIPDIISQYPPLPLIEGTEIIEENPDQTQLTTRYTERAVDFIQRKKDQPFFLYLAHSMPHIPLAVSDKFKGKSEQGLYGDVIMEIDWSVGEIIKALKKNGVYENTLLIFTSDNGPWLLYGDHGGSAYPLREGKGTSFEGGQRVPCIMNWPAKMPKNMVSSELVTTMDLLPTITELANADLPENKIDGKDISPILQGIRNAKSPTDVFYYISKESKIEAVRMGDWKLLFPHNYQHIAERGKNGYRGKTKTISAELELYNLKDDIGETNNVVAKNPELVEKMSKLAEEFAEELKREARPCGIVK